MSLTSLSVSYAEGLWLARLAEASASTIILFDYVLTFQEEFRLIWKARWGAGKILFLISRYYNLFAVILDKTCFAWLIWQCANAVFVYVVTSLIMILRLYAMFERSKKILIFTFASLAVVLAVEGVIMYFAIATATNIAHTVPHSAVVPTELCATFNAWKYSYLFWIPLMIYEVILFALSLYKGYLCYFKDNGDQYGYSGVKCMSVLIRDSILYFFAVFAVYVTCVIFWNVPNRNLQAMPIDFHPALSMVITQRLILNIRSHCAKQSGVLSDIEDVGTWFGGDRPDLIDVDVESAYPQDSVYEVALHDVEELPRFGVEGNVRDPENRSMDVHWDRENEK